MPRRKMADRAPGTGEVVSTARSAAAPAGTSPLGCLDVLSQARKSLALLSPFEGEESAPRVPTLPAGLASLLSRASESHRKQKKPQGESAEKPVGRGKPPTVWDETEEYFRPLTSADIDFIAPKLQLSFSSVDTCLIMPELGKETATDHNNLEMPELAAGQLSSISFPEKEELSEKQENDVEMVPVADEMQPIEINELMASNGDRSPVYGENHCNSSLHWLLGSKERFVLTSERPNKKRRLLGGDAGLDRLLQLPHSPLGAPLCDFCFSVEGTTKLNKLLQCHSCKVLVHQKCYGVHEVPEGVWSCNWCKHLETLGKNSDTDDQVSGNRPCLLCPKEGGALKMVRRNPPFNLSDAATKYAHLFCSLWTPEVHVEDTGAMELVMDVGGVQGTRRRLACNVCKVKHGVCIRCSHGSCRTSFHPLCARESKHQMEIWGKFGCDNVELRAFCTKHSTPQNLSSVEDSNNPITVVDHHSSEAKPSAILSTRKLPKLRFTRKNRDQIMMQNEITNMNSEKIAQMVPDVEQNALVNRFNPECGKKGPNVEMHSDAFNKNTIDVAATLRKLIDCGNINSDDVASNIGISRDSLQAALGETASFSPGLRLKIIKWLQNSAQLSDFPPSRDRSNPAVSSDTVKHADYLAAAKGNDPENTQASDEVTGVEASHAVSVKSLPPRGGLKSNIRILKNNKALHSSGVASILENGNDKMVDEINDIAVVINEDVKPDVDNKKNSDQNESYLQQLHITEDIKADEHVLHGDSYQGQKRSSLRSGSNDISEANHETCNIEGMVSSCYCASSQADDVNATQNASGRGLPTWSKNFDGGHAMLSSKCDRENVGFDSVSNLHPLIKRKLLHIQNSPLKSCHRTSFCDGTKFDQLSLAKNMGFVELSPEDEVEGEIVYLQARLLDNDVTIKHKCEDLLLKIVQSLPHELSSSNKCKWDLILVNQYLREVQEAKKRGRKERRHKEAQAVLAAAAAAAAASSRNSSLRKDSNEEAIMTNQEGPVKVDVANGRAGFQIPSMLRAREASRLSATKLSSDKHSLASQMPDFLKDNVLFCEICMHTETILNRIFVCSNCKVAVHLDCYHKLKNPIGAWKCEVCDDTLLPSTSPEGQTDGGNRVVQCGLCGGVTGALRKSEDGQWVHAFCAEWLLEMGFRRGQENPVKGMDTVLKEKDTCCICNGKIGACLKCSYGQCPNTFHPYCARAAGFYMDARATGSSLKHKAYCSWHSIEQREIDYQQCAAEDLKSLKQIRVELEKLRLLCERIIKREKLKKEMAVCSHDILATRRDYAAYSVLVSPFFPHGDSSESATTSINNRSYSGTVQRSDEITMDSSVSSKPTTRFSLNNRDFDRNTDDSSTSQLSFKWKLTNKKSFAGKQLPRRSTSITLRKSTEGEKKAKIRKTEHFQKELVMTSDQASVQNQRLPKGFFYIPVGSLSKEKALAQDLESCERQEPGG